MMRKYTRVLLLLAVVTTMTLLSDTYAEDDSGWATIEGVVTDAATGQPIPNIVVRTEPGWYHASSKTDAQGRYSHRVYAVDHRHFNINFNDPTSTYVTTWYGPAYTLKDAKLFSVTPGQVRRLNMKLERAGVLWGMLKVDEELIRQSDMGLSISDVNNTETGFSRSLEITSSGEYRFVGVPPGRYVASTTIYGYTILESYTIGYYDATSSRSKADIVEITSGVTSTADIDLTNLGEISGTVRERSGSRPVETYFEVVATNEDGDIVANAYTDENGQYRLQHLMPGMYTIHFTGNVMYPCDKGFYCPKPRYRRLGIEKLQVAPGQVISDIDASVRLILEPVAFLPLVMR